MVVLMSRQTINEPLRLLSAVNRLISEARNNELKPLGITTQQSAMLHRIRVLGDQATVNNIAQRMHRDQSTVSDMLKRLEKRRLVRRFIDPNDRRQVYIFLTEKGHRLCTKTKEYRVIRRILTQLPREKIQELTGTLRELYDICLKEKDNLPHNKADKQDAELIKT